VYGKFASKIRFSRSFVVELVGRSRSLALFWQVAEELEIQNYSRRHINAIVRSVDNDVS
jgi:hypothetical protein